MKEYFETFNGGKGLDHWSPTSSQNFTRFLINYSLPQEVRRSFKIRYKRITLVIHKQLISLVLTNQTYK